MNNAINLFKSFYQSDLSYFYPQEVDLQANLPRYSLSMQQPEAYEKIQRVLEQTFSLSGSPLTLADYLKLDGMENFQRDQLKARHFTILSGTNECSGIVLEHALAEGWLIKQNFTNGYVGEKCGRLVKCVSARQLPFWLFPSETWMHSKSSQGVRAQNDLINPLRVVMMERGEACIQRFHLDKIGICKEYLLELPGAPPSLPLHKRFVVVSEKASILNDKENCRHYARLAQSNPTELKEIVRQICVFIKHTHLTDMHIGNICFEIGNDRVRMVDAEPVGGLADISQNEMRGAYKRFDYALFPLLGMKKLQESTPNVLRENGIPEHQVRAVKRIFDEVINQAANEIIQNRRWHFTKIIASALCPLIPLSLFIFSMIAVFFARSRQALQMHTGEVGQPPAPAA